MEVEIQADFPSHGKFLLVNELGLATTGRQTTDGQQDSWMGRGRGQTDVDLTSPGHYDQAFFVRDGKYNLRSNSRLHLGLRYKKCFKI